MNVCPAPLAPAGEAEQLRAAVGAAAELDASAWDDLEAHAVEPNVFAGRHFALAFARAFGLGDLRALRFEQPNGRLAGLLLFRSRPRFPFHASEALVSPFAGSGAPLVREGWLEPVARAMVRALGSRQPLGRSLLVPLLPVGGRLAGQLLAAAEAEGIAATWIDRHQRAVLEPTGEPKGEYPATGGPRLRKYRTSGRRLEEQGALVVSSDYGAGEIAEGLEVFLALEASGWKGRLGTAASCNPAHEALMREVVPALARAGRCRVDALHLDGRPLAIGITLSSAGREWLWKIAYEETWGRYSPYVQLLIRQTRAALAAGEPADYDSCSRPGSTVVERVWHQRRDYGDLLLVAPGTLPPPRLAHALELRRRQARRVAVRLRDALRRRSRVSPAP